MKKFMILFALFFCACATSSTPSVKYVTVEDVAPEYTAFKREKPINPVSIWPDANLLSNDREPQIIKEWTSKASESEQHDAEFKGPLWFKQLSEQANALKANAGSCLMVYYMGKLQSKDNKGDWWRDALMIQGVPSWLVIVGRQLYTLTDENPEMIMVQLVGNCVHLKTVAFHHGGGYH